MWCNFIPEPEQDGSHRMMSISCRFSLLLGSVSRKSWLMTVAFLALHSCTRFFNTAKRFASFSKLRTSLTNSESYKVLLPGADVASSALRDPSISLQSSRCANATCSMYFFRYSTGRQLEISCMRYCYSLMSLWVAMQWPGVSMTLNSPNLPNLRTLNPSSRK